MLYKNKAFIFSHKCMKMFWPLLNEHAVRVKKNAVRQKGANFPSICSWQQAEKNVAQG